VVKASEAVYAGYENDVISSLALVKKGGGVGGAVKDANAWLQVPYVAMTNDDVKGPCLRICIRFMNSRIRRRTKYRTRKNRGIIFLSFQYNMY
jgi:hypothetical protein